MTKINLILEQEIMITKAEIRPILKTLLLVHSKVIKHQNQVFIKWTYCQPWIRLREQEVITVKVVLKLAGKIIEDLII